MVGRAGVTLETARATLRPWRHEEAERLFDIRRRPEVAKWLGDPWPWEVLQQAHDRIDHWASVATEAVPACLAIVPHGATAPVGYTSLNQLPNQADGESEVEIGWSLHPDSVGQGWATEAAAALLAHGFAHGLPRVWAIMWPDNHPSAGVATRIGMVDLGSRPDPWYGTEEDPESRMFLAESPAGATG